MRKAIGKAWPLFFHLVLNGDRSNKIITNYAELKQQLQESPNTIKKWREYLVNHRVIQVTQGRLSIMIKLLPPYDSLVTCEQDDVRLIQLKSDPATRKLFSKLSGYENMSLLPIVAELASKLDKLEKDMS
jgi:hypothetical protein